MLQFERIKVLQFERVKVLQFERVKVLQFGMDFRSSAPAARTRIFGAMASVPWPAAIRPTARHYFYLDLDRDDSTGGYPAESANPENVPENFPGHDSVGGPDATEEAGVDLIVEVVFSSTCPAMSCTSTATVNAFDYNDGTGQYELVFTEPESDISEFGAGLYIDNGGEFVEIDDAPYGMTVQPAIPNSVLYAAGWTVGTSPLGDPIPGRVRMEAVTAIECEGNILNDTPSQHRG